MLRVVSLAVVVLAGTACSTGAPQRAGVASERTAETAPSNAAPQQKICRDMDITGSNGPRRLCRTKEQWDKIDALG